MNARLPKRAALFLLATAVSLSLIAAPGASSTMSAGASLRVSPGDDYVGGQAVTFSGNIGLGGVRTIRLQSHMDRPGDSWESIDGFSAKTQSNGDFSFVHPAPAMFGIRYRVVSGKAATPGWTFEALSQDLTLEAATQPVTGVPFVLEVDTTPTLRRRPDTIGLRPIPGRGLTLQRRVDGDTWEQVARTEVSQYGTARFHVTEPDPGMVVYRAVQENWHEGGNRIGWFPSFPLYVRVQDLSGRAAGSTSAALSSSSRTMACHQPVVGDAATNTAAGVRGWAPSLFDFAWVAGESLTSPPYRGTRKQGRWVDYTDGGGRVNKHNGGLMLDSKRENDCGNGDFGTTRATLQGNPMTYGRWEVRLRLKSDETRDRDYRTMVQLVPERESDYACGTRNITIAEMRPHSSRVSFGANARSKRWKGVKSVGGAVNNRSLVFAVEVTKKRVSWFLGGKVIGSVKSRAASSDVPMTLRLSMVGDGNHEMNHTELISDWQRAFPLGRGKVVTSGKKLKQSTLKSSC